MKLKVVDESQSTEVLEEEAPALPIEQQGEYAIRYQTLPDWFAPSVCATIFAIGTFAVFLSPVAAMIAGHAILQTPALILEVFIRCVAVLLLGFLAFVMSEVGRHDCLILTKDGMSFPLMLAPDLLFRRKRGWDDIGNILLGAMLLEDKKGTYEYELEEAKDKKKMFIYFKSGGHVTLDLSRMPKKSVERLFLAIEAWCIECARSPQLHDRNKNPVVKPIKKEKMSYTELWEEELHSHFSATTFVPLEKGQSLQSGRLSILMQLSAGGFSAVYLAELPDKRLVVVKEAVLPPNLKEESRQKAKELFDREAQILRKLSHPNIAKVQDHFVENGRDYMVLEFVAGHTLRQVVTKKGLQDEETVLQYAKAIAEVLDYLHTIDPPVIHRDVTPDNIVLREDGSLVLIDFGAANEFVGTATGTLIGKQAYIAPEQFRGKARVQSDLFALGGTLFFLLTGQDPLPLSQSHPKSLRPELSDELDALLADLTAMEVKMRIQSADALLDRLNLLNQARAAAGSLAGEDAVIN